MAQKRLLSAVMVMTSVKVALFIFAVSRACKELPKLSMYPSLVAVISFPSLCSSQVTLKPLC